LADQEKVGGHNPENEGPKTNDQVANKSDFHQRRSLFLALTYSSFIKKELANNI